MVSFPRIRSVEPIQLPTHPGSEAPQFVLTDGAELSDEQVIVSHFVLYLLQLMDGTRSLPDICAELRKTTGIIIEKTQVESLLRGLDEHFLLDNERSREKLAALSPRPTRHAGSGYPPQRAELEPFLDRLLGKPNDRRVPQASILPHIDFFRGEATYRAGYQNLHGLAGDSTSPLTVIVLGISHALCHTPYIFTRKDFDTPLGVVETDQALVDFLTEDLPFDPYLDEFNHLAEHSVEFQVVLLKRLLGDSRPFKIVPVLCRSFHEAIANRLSPYQLNGVSEFIEKLKQLKDARNDLHFMASVDLAHMGTNFGGPPLTPSFLSLLEDRDQESLQGVRRGDAGAFFSTHQADSGERNYCGTPAIFTLLEVFPQKFDLHMYQQCTDSDLGSTVTICSATLAPE